MIRLMLFAAALLVALAAPPDPAEARDGAGIEDSIELRGRVVDAEGRPAPGVSVFLIRGTSALEEDHGVGRPWPVPTVRAVTGGEGEFRLRARLAEFVDLVPAVILAGDLAARASGAGARPPQGIGWAPAWVFDPSGQLRKAREASDESGAGAERREPLLRLVRDDVPLTGRVVDPQGRPVREALVAAVCVMRTKDEDLTGFLEAAEGQKSDYDKLRDDHTIGGVLGNDGLREEELSRLLRAETDADGRFTLRGIGRERIAWVRVEGAGIQTQRVFACTRPGPAVRVEHVHHSPGDVFTLHGATFEMQAAESAPIRGIVRDRDSGRPIPGVLVQGRPAAGRGGPAVDARALTDDQGRFELRGLPAGEVNSVMAVATDQPYLPAVQEAPVASGEAPPQLEFGLRRGTWIRGRVTDAKTGRPVRARAYYYAFGSNPALKELAGYPGAVPFPPVHRSDPDGRYAVPALPGRGIVGILVPGAQYRDYPLGAGAEAVPGAIGEGPFAFWETQPSPCSAIQFHALAEVDVPSRGEAAARDFALDSGETLVGRLRGPDGRPATAAMVYGVGPLDMMYLPLPSSDFRVLQYRADRPRLLLFSSPKARLATAVRVEGPQAGPLDVQLGPAGALAGRIIDRSGKPAPGLHLTSALRMSKPEDLKDSAASLPERYYTTDREGRFRVEGLAPGIKYSLIIASTRQELATDVKVGAGETKDLGDLTRRE